VLPRNFDALSARAAKEKADAANANVKALNIVEILLIATPNF
jgi:hypothetical protein